MNKLILCPCHSGKLYSDCCQPYHSGLYAENALALMRSRYSAYALHNADYIILTTHPQNPRYVADIPHWKKEVLAFAARTDYQGLKILEFIDGEEEAFVTFKAYLKQGDHDATFTEKSRFLKVNGRWLYKSGILTT